MSHMKGNAARSFTRGRASASFRLTVALLLTFALLSPVAQPASPPDVGAHMDEARDSQLVSEVSERLLGQTEPVPGVRWPPVFYIPTREELVKKWGRKPDDINAAAYIAPDGQPMVALFPAFMSEVIRGNPDALAFVIGHEIAHHTLGHTKRRDPRRTSTEYMWLIFSRDQEIAADIRGMELSLAAGYSREPGLDGIKRMMELGLEFNSFEGLDHDHPPWKERLQFIDREQAVLWRSMAAFDNGVFFLNVNQYISAEKSFEKVLEEFPASYDAHANLGYARLMQYCDGMDERDLRRLGLGHLLVGGFYRRPDTIFPPAKGIDEDLWKSAVESLEEAVKLKPDLTLARANLGVAYLVAPRGKDLKKAERHLTEAVRALPNDKKIDETARAAVLVNASVLETARGQFQKSAGLLDRAERAGQLIREARTRRNQSSRDPILAAVLYNRAQMSTVSNAPGLAAKKEAFAHLTRYFEAESPATFWWDLAYEHYAKLGSELKTPVPTKEELAARSGVCLAPIASLKLAPGVVITISDTFEDARKRLGEPQRRVAVVPDTDLARFDYTQHGIQLLGTHQIMAIFLAGAKAPALEVRPLGPNPKVRTLRIGMEMAEVRSILGSQYIRFSVEDPRVKYQYYPDSGVGVRFDEAGKLHEIIITQSPIERPCYKNV